MSLARRDDIKRFTGDKAGMDEATIVGLRERVHSGLIPLGNQFMNNAG